MSNSVAPLGRLWGLDDWLEQLDSATVQIEGNLPINGDLHLDSRKIQKGDAFLRRERVQQR